MPSNVEPGPISTNVRAALRSQPLHRLVKAHRIAHLTPPVLGLPASAKPTTPPVTVEISFTLGSEKLAAAAPRRANSPATSSISGE